jgi:hypothetical protein
MMSDFLSRVAARATGEPPVARPRVHARFERPEAADVGVEIVDEEAVARAAPARADAPQTEANAGSATVSDRSGPRGGPDVTTAQRPVERSLSGPAPDEPPTTLPAPHTQAAPPQAPMLEPPRADRASEEPESVVALDLPSTSTADRRTPLPLAVPAAPAAPAVPPLAVPEGAAPREEHAVRVHIGRLEVRANLQHAPPQPPPREQARQPALSLAEYLRGKRGIG